MAVHGWCTKAMKNCIEKFGDFKDIKWDHNVVEPLKMIKQQAFDANEKSTQV